MKELYDKLFDGAIALFILIAILSSAVMIITSVVFTIQTGDHHTGITTSSAILTGLAVAVSYFYLALMSGRRPKDDE